MSEKTGIETEIPKKLILAVLAICAIPVILNFLGVDFGTEEKKIDLALFSELDRYEQVDSMPRILSGSFTHTILEWSAFSTAIFTVILAFVHFDIKNDITTPIIGVALFFAGTMDAFHTLAADRLIEAVADNRNLIPFTWAICRLFNVLILIVGVSFFLLRKPTGKKANLHIIFFSSLVFGIVAYGIIHICATSSYLPKTMFPQSLITRPYDVVPLVLFVFAGVFIYPRFYRLAPSFFSHALIISVIPEIATQLHMAFGSKVLFDNHFNIAHFLKILAYFVPFIGLCLDYVKTYREETYLVEKLEQSNKNLEKEIIERKKTERERKNTADHLSKILRSIGEGVIVTDSDNRLVLINKVAEDFLGIKEVKSISKIILTELADEKFTRDWIELLMQDEDVVTMEMQITHPVFKTLLATQSKYRNKERKIIGSVTILRDITREKEIDRMKTEFVSSVSHELRTPLTSIKGFSVTILRDKEMPEDTRTEFLKIIEKESARLSDLIEDLLDISRIESNRLDMKRGQVSIVKAIMDSIKSIEPQFKQKAVRLETELPEENLLSIISDSDRIIQVFQNLLSNAVKFTPEGGVVKVIAKEVNGFIHIEIRDSGVGIPEKDLPHVFEKFYRVYRPGIEIRGTGLGLPIVKSIIEESGGEISVKSKKEKGTSVFLKFPNYKPEKSILENKN